MEHIIGTGGKTWGNHLAVCQNQLYPFCSHQNSWDLWMFIPLKMVLIGIDPYPSIDGRCLANMGMFDEFCHETLSSSTLNHVDFKHQTCVFSSREHLDFTTNYGAFGYLANMGT